MSSTWRKQETFKEKPKSYNSSVHFSNIPMFDVLRNTSQNEKKMDNRKIDDDKKDTIIEGFDWEGLDYFHHHGQYSMFQYSSKIREMIEKLMKMLTSPISKIDKIIEDAIYDILMMFLMLSNSDCDKKSLNNLLNKTSGDVKKSFFWMSGNKDTEGFSLNDQPEFKKTINSFKINHSDFIVDEDVEMQVGNYYITTLNAYETKLRRKITDDELFLFNNDFDNLLNDPNIQNKIIKVNINKINKLSKGVINENNEDEYKKYYEKSARFKINNTNKINTYYTFNNDYFPIPSNQKVFDDELSTSVYTNTLLTRKRLYDKDRSFLFKTNKSEPPTPESDKEKDTNYIFSVNTSDEKMLESIQNYLNYVIKYYSYIIFASLPQTDNLVGFQEIEARVGTTYTNLLNRIDFLYYNAYETYLDEYQIAVFNQIFFILIQQLNNSTYNDNSNKYKNITDNKPVGPSQNKTVIKDIFSTIIKNINDKTNKIYIKKDLTDNTDLTNDANFPSLSSVTSSVSNVAAEGLRSNNSHDPIQQTSALLPFSSTDNPNITNPNIVNKTLYEYILDTNNVTIDDEIKQFYIPSALSECEIMKKNAQKDFHYYAKVIKNELYRLLLIPVILYVVYNIYYMFFFRDCSGPVRNPDGTYINKGETCKNPIFPDWESYFHSYENHNTDLLFEYIFKPSKIMYTWLNAIKAIFRSVMPLLSIKLLNFIPPYIFLFVTVIMFFTFFNKYAGTLFNFFTTFFMTLSVPFVKLFKVDSNTAKTFKLPPENGNWAGFNEIAMIITGIFFGGSILKDIGGFNWYKFMNGFAVNIENDTPEPEVKSWISWIATQPFVFILAFCKFVVFILYWLFKFFIAFAMVPVASVISVFYLFYTIFFGISNNTDSDTDYFTKTELIDRIIYTRLYDVHDKTKWDYVVYIFKSICFLIMAFMTELLVVYVLYRGLNNIKNNITGTPQADGIQLFLTIIYMCIFIFIVLWCLYKYKTKLPILETFFSNKKDEETPIVPNKDSDIYKNLDDTFNKNKYNTDLHYYNKITKIKEGIDKRFDLLKNEECDIHERLSENTFYKIIFGSDVINKEIIKDEIHKKTEAAKNPDNHKKPSFAEKWSSKIIGTMGSIGDKMLQKGQNIMTDLSNSDITIQDKFGRNFSKAKQSLYDAKANFNPKGLMSSVGNTITKNMNNIKIPGIDTFASIQKFSNLPRFNAPLTS